MTFLHSTQTMPFSTVQLMVRYPSQIERSWVPDKPCMFELMQRSGSSSEHQQKLEYADYYLKKGVALDVSLNLLVINGEYLHTETSCADFLVHKCRTLVFCQSSQKILIIISAECARGESGAFSSSSTCVLLGNKKENQRVSSYLDL